MRPAWMVETAEALAAVRGWSLEKLAQVELENALALFPRLR
jgi:Tat protein secretion system quality control protein TatD with DNase activity